MITYGKMRKVKEHLKFFSFDDRITKLGPKPDRADVIMPALKIYMSVMKGAAYEPSRFRRSIWQTEWSESFTGSTSDRKRSKSWYIRKN